MTRPALSAPVTAAPASRTGVEGNARLTGSTAALLFFLLFVEGVTILQVRQLMTVHVFVGVLLIPPVLLKVGSTTWRFVRYYTGHPDYVRKGPPTLFLRGTGPLVVLTTLAVLFTGVGLLFVAPGTAQWLVQLHKVSFVLWFGLMSLHVLAHLRDTAVLAARDWRGRPDRGTRLRRTFVALSLVVGVGVGAAAVPAAAPWTTWFAAHHHGGDQ